MNCKVIVKDSNALRSQISTDSYWSLMRSYRTWHMLKNNVYSTCYTQSYSDYWPQDVQWLFSGHKLQATLPQLFNCSLLASKILAWKCFSFFCSTCQWDGVRGDENSQCLPLRFLQQPTIRQAKGDTTNLATCHLAPPKRDSKGQLSCRRGRKRKRPLPLSDILKKSCVLLLLPCYFLLVWFYSFAVLHCLGNTHVTIPTTTFYVLLCKVRKRRWGGRLGYYIL